MSYAYSEYHPESKYNGYPFTFMALDIAALQFLYGANTSYNSGNNTYYLTSTHTVNDGGLKTNEGVNSMCIYDTGGEDTISTVNQVVYNLIQQI